MNIKKRAQTKTDYGNTKGSKPKMLAQLFSKYIEGKGRFLKKGSIFLHINLTSENSNKRRNS